MPLKTILVLIVSACPLTFKTGGTKNLLVIEVGAIRFFQGLCNVCLILLILCFIKIADFHLPCNKQRRSYHYCHVYVSSLYQQAVFLEIISSSFIFWLRDLVPWIDECQCRPHAFVSLCELR